MKIIHEEIEIEERSIRQLRFDSTNSEAPAVIDKEEVSKMKYQCEVWFQGNIPCEFESDAPSDVLVHNRSVHSSGRELERMKTKKLKTIEKRMMIMKKEKVMDEKIEEDTDESAKADKIVDNKQNGDVKEDSQITDEAENDEVEDLQNKKTSQPQILQEADENTNNYENQSK